MTNSKLTYFLKKLEQTINEKDFPEARLYYDKAIAHLGDLPELTAYKAAITKGLKTAPAAASTAEQTPQPKKSKPINETRITLIVASIGLVIALVYYFSAVYPLTHLKDGLCQTWYQGNVTSGWNSDGCYLEIERLDGNLFEIDYRAADGIRIANLDGEIISGNEIVVNGSTISVRFDKSEGTVTFSPSFFSLSEHSVWREDREQPSNDPTGDF